MVARKRETAIKEQLSHAAHLVFNLVFNSGILVEFHVFFFFFLIVPISVSIFSDISKVVVVTLSHTCNPFFLLHVSLFRCPTRNICDQLFNSGVGISKVIIFRIPDNVSFLKCGALEVTRQVLEIRSQDS